MKLWVAHPTGNTFVRALLAELEARDWDYRFFTSLGFSHEEGWLRAVGRVSGSLGTELSRRAYDIPRERISRRVPLELKRLLAQRIHPRNSQQRADRIYADIDSAVAARIGDPEIPQAVYAYEDGALHIFQAAAQHGAARVYDLPIAYHERLRALLAIEADRWPLWASTLGAAAESSEKVERKTQELELADVVVCPSTFVLDSLPARARENKRCIVSDFGSPSVPMRRAAGRKESPDKLRVLFAGSMTQRKGLADLFSAMRMLDRKDVELVVLGAKLLPLSFYRREYAAFIYEPPRSQGGVLEMMQSCDILVLPSIVEGRALAQQEALACGLPLIVTRNAGAEDLIIEGETGFLVPPGSPRDIAERIDWFASHRSELSEMCSVCRAKAAEYSWSEYARRILDSADELVGSARSSVAA
jgi:glycosyltransferase involved in cell wall biosynthesis